MSDVQYYMNQRTISALVADQLVKRIKVLGIVTSVLPDETIGRLAVDVVGDLKDKIVQDVRRQLNG